MIHGDAWRGNLLRDGKRVVLADWETVSIGPREIDLIPTLQAPRFGLQEEERDAFIAAYGRDIRTCGGYPVLREMRELSTLSANLRDGHTDPAAKRELVIRVKSLRSGDDQHWTSFDGLRPQARCQRKLVALSSEVDRRLCSPLQHVIALADHAVDDPLIL